ncbi:hypothetical protein PC120_g14466 [Phytophthora cactorum]|nr:hypothetical protein PC120_g14466 [Phytophthora cactorum]
MYFTQGCHTQRVGWPHLSKHKPLLNPLPAARCPLSAGPAVPCPRVRPHCPLLSLSAGPATPCPLIPLRCPLVSSSAGTAYCPSRCPLARCLLVLLSAGVAVAGVADR